MSKKIPSEWLSLIAENEKRAGLPAGTMLAVLSKEIGGQEDRFVKDPTAYHYGLNAEGKRIAGHTGKVSTAFGPFGILESTARDPGYGVKPMADKSLPEQARFATDYLAARAKQAGSLQAGLAGYGEGKAYGADAMARLSGGRGQGVAVAQAAPVTSAPVVAQATAPAVAPVVYGPEQVADMPEVKGIPPELLNYLASRTQVAAVPEAKDAWGEFLGSMRAAEASRRGAPVQAEELNYAAAFEVPEMKYAPMATGRVNFSPFQAFSRRMG